MPNFISFKSKGVLLSPVAKAPGGISGTITPTVGVTIPEMFNFWKISCGPEPGVGWMMLDVSGFTTDWCHRLIFLGILSMIYEWWEMYPNVDYHWSTWVCVLDSAENFSHINCQPSNKSYSNWPMRTDATGSRQRRMQIMTTMRFQYSGPSNKFRTSWLMHFNKIGMTWQKFVPDFCVKIQFLLVIGA